MPNDSLDLTAIRARFAARPQRSEQAESLGFTPLRSKGAPDLPREADGARFVKLELQPEQPARN